MSSSFRGLARLFAVATAIVATSGCGVAAQTWGGGFPSTNSRAQFERGYRDGLRAGDTDARRGERFNFTDERGYRQARGNYAFRDGFERGYNEGYRRRGGYVGRGGRGGYGGRGGRGDGGYGGYGGRVYANPATARGFEDGYKAGRDDGRDGDRYNPIGARDYRDGENGYDRRFGTREQWKIAYREGFKAGYDRGYREGRR